MLNRNQLLKLVRAAEAENRTFAEKHNRLVDEFNGLLNEHENLRRLYTATRKLAMDTSAMCNRYRWGLLAANRARHGGKTERRSLQ
jgi:hypothetical protein